jgi:hypothetical protein
VDFTGEVELLAPVELGAKRRKLKRAGAIGVATVVAALGVALYWWQPWRDDCRRKNAKPATTTASTMDGRSDEIRTSDLAGAMSPPRSDATEAVTVRFLSLPPGGQVTLDGRVLPGNTTPVARQRQKLRFVATAPGGLRHTGWVTPDQDRVVLLTLTRLSPFFPAANGRNRPRLRCSADFLLNVLQYASAQIHLAPCRERFLLVLAT